MEKELFKKVDYYWFWFILTIILSYGFYLTHSSMGIDDEIMNAWIRPYSMLSVNRIGRVLSHFLQIWDYVPFWKEFLAVCAYSVGITLHARNFMTFLNYDSFKFDKKMATIFSCVAVSFPFFAFHLIFMITCLVNGLNIIFSALAINYLYKYVRYEQKKSYLLYIFLLLLFIVSYYELGILYFIIPVCFIEFVGFVFEKNKKVQTSYKTLLLAICITGLGISLIYAISYLWKYIIGYDSHRFEDWLRYDFSSLSGFISSLINSVHSFIGNFLQTCSYDAGSVVTLFLYVIFIGILVYYVLKRKSIHILFYGLLIMLLPFSIFILTGKSDIFYRTYSALGFVNAFVVSLLYFICMKREFISKLILIVAGIIVFYQSLEINQILYTENLKVENDRLFAYSLKQEVDKLGGKPLLLIGTRENPKLKYEYFIEAAEINVSTFNWDRYDNINGELFVGRPYSFMREQGFEVSSYTREHLIINNDEDYYKFILKLKNLSKNMPIYPVQGSVKDCDDFILIKIGESRLDEKEEELP